MISYVPDAKLGFATDIWSPGAAPLPDKLNPALASVVAVVKKNGIEPSRFAGGHASVADYAPLGRRAGTPARYGSSTSFPVDCRDSK